VKPQKIGKKKNPPFKPFRPKGLKPISLGKYPTQVPKNPKRNSWKKNIPNLLRLNIFNQASLGKEFWGQSIPVDM